MKGTILRAFSLLTLLALLPGSAYAIPAGWLPSNISGVKAAIADQGAAITTLQGEAANVTACNGGQMFCASGSSQTTTGSITVGTNALTVASAIDFKVGQGISIASATAAAENFATTITAINGTAITLAANAGRTVAGVAVYHDDGPAFQAAIDSWGATRGGPVFVPRGYYPINSTVSLRTNGSLFGPEHWPHDSGADTWLLGSTTDVMIDASKLTVNGATVFTASTNAAGVAISNMRIVGSGQLGGQYAIHISVATSVLIRNVSTFNFQFGTKIETTSHVLLSNLLATGIGYAGVDLYACSYVQVFGGLVSNGAQNGNANLWIQGGSTDVVVDVPVVDETFGTGSAAIRILSANRVLIRNARVWWGDYGIQVGDGVNNPSNVTLSNLKVEGYPSNTIGGVPITLYGTGHLLQDLQVSTGGKATPIVDNTTDAVFRNVMAGCTSTGFAGGACSYGCDSTASPGAATCIASQGRASIAAGASSVVITDTITRTNTRIVATLQTVDGTCKNTTSVVPAAGSFTINVNAACTGTTNVAWSFE